eukprot:gene4813-109_t
MGCSISRKVPVHPMSSSAHATISPDGSHQQRCWPLYRRHICQGRILLDLVRVACQPHLAAEKNLAIESVLLYLSRCRRSDVNYRSPYQGISSLSTACEAGNIVLVDALLRAGAEPNLQLKQGNTCAHLAAQLGHTVCLFRLIEAGADITLRNKLNQSVLCCAKAALADASGMHPGKAALCERHQAQWQECIRDLFLLNWDSEAKILLNTFEQFKDTTNQSDKDKGRVRDDEDSIRKQYQPEEQSMASASSCSPLSVNSVSSDVPNDLYHGSCNEISLYKKDFHRSDSVTDGSYEHEQRNAFGIQLQNKGWQCLHAFPAIGHSSEEAPSRNINDRQFECSTTSCSSTNSSSRSIEPLQCSSKCTISNAPACPVKFRHIVVSSAASSLKNVRSIDAISALFCLANSLLGTWWPSSSSSIIQYDSGFVTSSEDGDDDSHRTSYHRLCDKREAPVFGKNNWLSPDAAYFALHNHPEYCRLLIEHIPWHVRKGDDILIGAIDWQAMDQLVYHHSSPLIRLVAKWCSVVAAIHMHCADNCKRLSAPSKAVYFSQATPEIKQFEHTYSALTLLTALQQYSTRITKSSR